MQCVHTRPRLVRCEGEAVILLEFLAHLDVAESFEVSVYPLAVVADSVQHDVEVRVAAVLVVSCDHELSVLVPHALEVLT